MSNQSQSQSQVLVRYLSDSVRNMEGALRNSAPRDRSPRKAGHGIVAQHMAGAGTGNFNLAPKHPASVLVRGPTENVRREPDRPTRASYDAAQPIQRAMSVGRHPSSRNRVSSYRPESTGHQRYTSPRQYAPSAPSPQPRPTPEQDAASWSRRSSVGAWDNNPAAAAAKSRLMAVAHRGHAGRVPATKSLPPAAASRQHNSPTHFSPQQQSLPSPAHHHHHHSSPVRNAHQQHTSPARGLSHHHSFPVPNAPQHHGSPARGHMPLEPHLREPPALEPAFYMSPVRQIDRQYTSPARQLDQHQRSPTRHLDPQDTSPTRHLDQQQHLPPTRFIDPQNPSYQHRGVSKTLERRSNQQRPAAKGCGAAFTSANTFPVLGPTAYNPPAHKAAPSEAGTNADWWRPSSRDSVISYPMTAVTERAEPSLTGTELASFMERINKLESAVIYEKRKRAEFQKELVKIEKASSVILSRGDITTGRATAGVPGRR